MDTYEEEDEEEEEDTRWTMTPYPEAYDAAKPLRMDFVCVVAAKLTLHDSETYPGYLKAKGTGMTTVKDAQPVLFAPHGPVDFYSGVHVPTGEEIAKNYELLGKSADQVFPLSYRSKVLLGGLTSDAYVGTVDGFHYMDTGPLAGQHEIKWVR